MSLATVELGSLAVSRFIIGGNPFSGFSHQGVERDLEMRRYYTAERIKAAWKEAESLGITTCVGRVDAHIMRLLAEYWDGGGKIKWIAQTAPELQSAAMAIDRAVASGASACFVHGGQTDYAMANGKMAELPDAIDRIRQAGLPAGIAGHNPDVFRWADEHLDVDFYMCSYYNPSSRAKRAEHVAGTPEWFDDDDRTIMVDLIQGLSRPAIHYKVLAAGRKEPADGLSFAARHMRPGDAVCVGAYTGDKPGMLGEDLEILERGLNTV